MLMHTGYQVFWMIVYVLCGVDMRDGTFDSTEGSAGTNMAHFRQRAILAVVNGFGSQFTPLSAATAAAPPAVRPAPAFTTVRKKAKTHHAPPPVPQAPPSIPAFMPALLGRAVAVRAAAFAPQAAAQRTVAALHPPPPAPSAAAAAATPTAAPNECWRCHFPVAGADDEGGTTCGRSDDLCQQCQGIASNCERAECITRAETYRAAAAAAER